MSGNFTAAGTPLAEERVREDLARILETVRRHVPGDRLDGLALTGGFGRGEGGVVTGPDGRVTAFNDYDFVVLTKGPFDGASLLSAAPALAAELGVDFVDFGIFPSSLLPEVPETVFWYELREGHRVLIGRQDLLLAIPPIDPSRLPLVEGTRLLVNRGLSLLWAWVHLEEAGDLDDVRLRFVVNSVHKAVLAIGDAALIRAGRYHLSYRERALRIDSVPLPWPGRDAESFRSAHGAATRFKLDPRVETTGKDALASWWRSVRDWHETALRWMEEARLEKSIGPWGNYPARLAQDSIQEGIRHPRRYLRERGAAESIRGWSRHFLDTEHASRARLPFLLYGAGPAGFDVSLLSSGLNGFSGDPARVRTEWRRLSLDLLEEWHP